MNAHRRTFAVAALVVLGALYAGVGCSKSGSEGSASKGATAEKVAATESAAKPAVAPAAPAPAEKIKLTVNDFGVFGYKPLYAEYQQSHPNIEIVESVSEYNTHHMNLINHLAAGSG